MLDKKKFTQNTEESFDELEIQNEYNKFVKNAVTNDSYFKDAKDWYIFRYVNPICDRTILLIAILVLFSLFYIIKNITSSLYPITISQPIFVESKDQNLYQTKIIKVKPKKGEQNYDSEIQTFDESILKYLIVNYIKDRESFDFRKGLVDDVNKKFNHIKSNSSYREYKNFQAIMSKNNKNSPIHYFGKNVMRDVKIINFKFKRREGKNAFEKAIFYIANSPPLEAEIDFLTLTVSVNDLNEKEYKNERFIAKITYDYQQIFKKDKQNTIGFTVNQYVLYKFK